jgi:hypothetical protein
LSFLISLHTQIRMLLCGELNELVFMNSVWTLSEEYLNSAWRVSEQCLNSIWTVSEQCLNSIWTVSEHTET